VVTSAVLVWPALTGQTATGPTPPANEITTSPPTNPRPLNVLPPHAVIARLNQNTWHVKATTRTPKLTRQEAIAKAKSAAGIHSPGLGTVHAWLLAAISVRDGIDLSCIMGCTVNPAWLVQFPSPPLLGGPPATPHSMVGNLVLIDATTGDILLGSHSAPPADHGSLSDREYSVAVDIARKEVDKSATSLTSASATVETGTVTNSNMGHPCTSGTLLQIRLIGTFNIVHGGVPGEPYEPVSMVKITADPESGFACLIGVGTGHVTPAPGATILFTH